MPGTVSKVMVEVGQVVNKEQTLLIVEAMKMEVIINYIINIYIININHINIH